MYFILSVLFMLCAFLILILYRILVEILIPYLRVSKYTKILLDRISRDVYFLYVDILKDVCAYLQTICEPEGDENFEPFLDSPLRTCPPCEFVSSSPKKVADENNNEPLVETPRIPIRVNRARRRRVINLPAPPRSPPLLRQNLLLRIIPNGEMSPPPPNSPRDADDADAIFREIPVFQENPAGDGLDGP